MLELKRAKKVFPFINLFCFNAGLNLNQNREFHPLHERHRFTYLNFEPFYVKFKLSFLKIGDTFNMYEGNR